MSLFGALFSGVSGLAAQSQAMGIIADNITNVNTTAFKRTTSEFSSLVTGSRSANSFAPGGVRPAVRQLVDTQGLLQVSNSPTDLAINGDGFVVVSDITAPTATTGQFSFTRAGSFTPQGLTRTVISRTLPDCSSAATRSPTRPRARSPPTAPTCWRRRR